ncbi:MAG: hypothetical protein EBS19_15925, partial [Spirochaetia bacterium]|nr:hypothetical protein [Spirochaetia bacterium]
MSNIISLSIKVYGFFNAPVVSVSISSFPYAVLRNGEHIFPGAKVNNGYTVDSITQNGIELINHGNKKTIPLNTLRRYKRADKHHSKKFVICSPKKRTKLRW